MSGKFTCFAPLKYPVPLLKYMVTCDRVQYTVESYKPANAPTLYEQNKATHTPFSQAMSYSVP